MSLEPRFDFICTFNGTEFTVSRGSLVLTLIIFEVVLIAVDIGVLIPR